MKKFLLISFIVLFLCSILVMVIPVAATPSIPSVPESQIWYLDSDGGAVNPFKIMYRADKTQSSDSVTIPAGGEIFWLANEAAGDDVTFPTDGGWNITLITQENWGKAYTIEVGAYDTNTATFTLFDTTIVTQLSYTGLVLMVKVENEDATVPIGDYLALKIENTDNSNNHTVITNGGSFLVSPITDPGYPLPELAAGILFGLGLAGLGGYVVVRRKQAGRVTENR